MEKALSYYYKRRQKWLNGLADVARNLAEQIEAVLAESLKAVGFRVVPYTLNDPKKLVERSDIVLEKECEFGVCNVHLSFDKYDRPAFQINLIKRDNSEEWQILDSSNLVANNKQFVYFWGKPWWVPAFFWSKKSSRNLVEKISRLIFQIEAFFESGERGKNISHKVEGSL